MKDKDPKVEFKSNAWCVEEAYENKGMSCIPERFGMCSKCTHLNYSLYEYGDEKISCGYAIETRTWANGKNMIECSNFSQRGQLSLVEMADMAIFINENKHKVGFRGEK